MPTPEPAAPTYEILANGHAIQCLVCLKISLYELDILRRYCPRCHVYHDAPASEKPKEPAQ
jgi:hypothetical protein